MVCEMLSPVEIRELLALFPVGLCWESHVHADGDWFVAELHRPTKDGPDVLSCGMFRTEEEAYASCVIRARQVMEFYRDGDSSMLAILRASIRYAKGAKDAAGVVR